MKPICAPMDLPVLTLALPSWVGALLEGECGSRETVEERMELVIELSRLNVEKETGGPFGAAVFQQHTGQLVAVGVNLVVPSACSLAHAEMLALAVSQQRIGSHDLGGPEMPIHELVTSTEPCAMCLGAIPWSGVRRVVCGARDEDARAIGFDEGPKPSDWVSALERRGIDVLRDVLRSRARDVLSEYSRRGRVIYNSRQG